MHNRIVFIDAALAQDPILSNAIGAGHEIVFLDSAGDGLAQMQSHLAGRSGIDSIVVVSHGAAGAVRVGTTIIDGSTVGSHAEALRAIGGSLTAAGDLLFYACNLAANDAGLSLIARLSDLTGADVAASSNLTGSAGRGGDWVLEAATGSIEAPPAVSAARAAEWDGVLAANTGPTFNTGNGTVNTLVGRQDNAQSIAVQADGKIVIAGHTLTQSSSQDFAVARFNTDGSLDTTFFGSGKQTASFGSSADEGHSVMLQADGKIVVGGSGSPNGNRDYAVVRFLTDGNLDDTFDGDGKVSTTVSPGNANEQGWGIALQSDGKILLLADNGVLRYNANGTLDSTFDGDGILGAGGGRISTSEQGLALQSDGKILLTGRTDNSSTNTDVLILRYNADGSPDGTFDGDGRVTTTIGAIDTGNAVAVQGDGKILVAGTVDGAGVLLRYNTNGSLDTSFDGDGRVSAIVGSDIRVQSDGRIVVAGSGIARYNADGSLDATFQGNTSSVDGIALQSDGKIVVASSPSIAGTPNFAVTRFNANGSLDNTFGSGNSLGGTRTFVENGPPIVLDDNVRVFDAELSAQGNYAGATLTLGQPSLVRQDVFSATGSLGTLTQGSALVYSGVTVGTVTTNSGGTLVLTFNADATQARVDGVMQAIAYSNTSDTPASSAQIQWIFSDGNTGAQGTTTDTRTTVGNTTVNITPVNDAPVATIVPTLYAVDSQHKVALQGTGLSVADGDGDLNAAALTVVVSAVSGILTATTGSTGVAISGSGTHSVTLSARLHQLNNLLAGNLGGTLTYSNDASSAGTDTLTLFINDNGNTGTGGAKSGSDTAVIDLGAIPSSPPLILPPADYNGDGKADVLLKNGASGQIWEYQMNGLAIGAQGSVDSPTTQWKVVGNSDYNADGKSDVLLRNEATGQIWQYQMNGLQIAAQASVDSPTTQWKVVGNADYNGDGKADVLLRHDTTGEIWQYQMNGLQIAAQGRVDLPTTQWKVVGNGDYNGDGKADVLLRNDATGEIWQYQMNGIQIAAQGRVDLPTTQWKVVGNADFNGDGKTDVLLRNDATGQIWEYQMNGLQIAAQGLVDSPDTNWRVVGNGDYNGDGKADVLLRHEVFGDVWEYQMDGLGIGAQGLVDAPDPSWKIVGNGDYNGDGKADVLLRNDATGQVWEYQMNGLHIMAQTLVDSPDTNWAIVA